MTDKQIIVDGVDVSGCSYHYKHTRVCLVKMDAAGRYYNCANWHDCDFKRLSQQLKRKEQDCEELKSVRDSWISKCEQETKIKELYQDGLDQLKVENERLNNIIEEAKNSKLDLKSFLVGEAVQNEYEEQLENLKLDNKHLNGLLDQALKELEETRELNDENSLRVTQLATKCCQLQKALEKVKELIQKEIADCEHWGDCTSCEYNCCTRQILQICDEVNDEQRHR